MLSIFRKFYLMLFLVFCMVEESCWGSKWDSEVIQRVLFYVVFYSVYCGGELVKVVVC